MKLENIFNEYLTRSEQIIISQKATKEIAKSEIEKLIKLKEKTELKLSENKSNHTTYFFFIQDAKTGEIERYSTNKKTLEDKIKDVFLQQNRQYQWALSESYEIFKDYVISIYAYMGFTDRNKWPLKDFGTILFSELENKNFDYFIKQAQIKKDIPESILNRIRATYPEYKIIESNNKLEKNLLLEIILIEHLRHLIVHCQGMTTDKTGIINNILKKAGLWNNGKNNENYDYISSFFGVKSLNNTINLLEIEQQNETGFPNKYFDVLGNLINSLTSVSYLIYSEIKKETSG
ncbi:hypothetical protein ACIGCP_19520 [Cellulophaga baltica]|uniref:hypothetical protein n=1 Tax=Cellulophaga baltica TaxID=76594 RepID=UPI0037CC4642